MHILLDMEEGRYVATVWDYFVTVGILKPEKISDMHYLYMTLPPCKQSLSEMLI